VTLLGQVSRPTAEDRCRAGGEAHRSVERVIDRIEVCRCLRTIPIRLATYRAIYGHAALNRYALQARTADSYHCEEWRPDPGRDVVANEADKTSLTSRQEVFQAYFP